MSLHPEDYQDSKKKYSAAARNSQVGRPTPASEDNQTGLRGRSLSFKDSADGAGFAGDMQQQIFQNQAGDGDEGDGHSVHSRHSKRSGVNHDKDAMSIHSKNSKAPSAVSGRSGKSGGGRSKQSAAGQSTGGNSFGSDTSDGSVHGKSVADTSVRKLIYMMSAFVSLLFHILYLSGAVILHSKGGMVLPFGGSGFANAGPIIAIVWARIAFLITDQAITDALAALVGYFLSTKEGYSIAACGFIQSSFGEKLAFPNRLSFRSTAKPFLARVSLFYLYHALMLIPSMMASTGIETYSSRIDDGALMCIQYDQEMKPFDRKVPTMYNAMGVAELTDGTAIGYLRIDPQWSDLNNSVAIFSPQLIDVCNDGSTIKGNGFTTNVSTTCYCSHSGSPSDLERAGVSSTVSAAFSQKVNEMDENPGWVNHITHPADANSSFTVTTVLTGSSTCGGANFSSPPVPVCITTFSHHQSAYIMVQYKTDGTPASIAAETATLLEILKPQDSTYLADSMENFFEGDLSSHFLPSHWPGSANPLLWFASENMQDVSLGLVEAGMEATMTLMHREAIQRSYSTVGGTCTQNVIDPSTTTLRMSNYAYGSAIVWIISQLIINAIIFAAYVPWWLHKYPMMPAVEVSRDNIIFSLYAAKNGITYNRMKSMSSNMEAGLMWPRLDIILRVGESVQTKDDPERGVIVLDKPKLVTVLNYDKKYI